MGLYLCTAGRTGAVGLPGVSGGSPGHEVDDLGAVEVDDAEGLAGWEVEGVAVGGGDDVRVDFCGGFGQSQGREDVRWVRDLRGGRDALGRRWRLQVGMGFAFGFASLGWRLSSILSLSSASGYGFVVVLLFDRRSDSACHLERCVCADETRWIDTKNGRAGLGSRERR